MNISRSITFLVILALAVVAPLSHAQSEARLAKILERHPDADANGDGVLTKEEYNAARASAEKSQGKAKGKGK